MILATLIPAYIALFLIPSLKGIPTKYLAAAGVGLTFWFFFDTMGDASALDENYGLYPPSLFGGWSHWGAIAAFALGVAALATFDRFAVRKPGADAGWKPGPNTLFIIPAAVAIVMGVHGLGEGWDASSAVAGATISAGSLIGALLQAFGTIPAVISYPIHKFLEASIIGIVYTAYVVRAGGGIKGRWWQIVLLGVFFGGPSVIGAGLGYFVAFNTIYFYAFGVTAALYAALRLIEPMMPNFSSGVTRPLYLGDRVFLAMAIGFFLLYTAALMH